MRHALYVRVKGTASRLFDIGSRSDVTETIVGHPVSCTPWTRVSVPSVPPLLGYPVCYRRDVLVREKPTLIERITRTPPPLVVVEQRVSWDGGGIIVTSTFVLEGRGVMVYIRFGEGNVKAEWSIDARNGSGCFFRRSVDSEVRKYVYRFVEYLSGMHSC